jgi:hypothetical protein
VLLYHFTKQQQKSEKENKIEVEEVMLYLIYICMQQK